MVQFDTWKLSMVINICIRYYFRNAFKQCIWSGGRGEGIGVLSEGGIFWSIKMAIKSSTAGQISTSICSCCHRARLASPISLLLLFSSELLSNCYMPDTLYTRPHLARTVAWGDSSSLLQTWKPKFRTSVSSSGSLNSDGRAFVRAYLALRIILWWLGQLKVGVKVNAEGGYKAFKIGSIPAPWNPPQT